MKRKKKKNNAAAGQGVTITPSRNKNSGKTQGTFPIRFGRPYSMASILFGLVKFSINGKMKLKG
jgi:hypothetical protein